MTTDDRGKAALTAALATAEVELAARYDDWDPRDLTDAARKRWAAAILAELRKAGWTVELTQSPVTNAPPPQLVEELYP